MRTEVLYFAQPNISVPNLPKTVLDEPNENCRKLKWHFVSCAYFFVVAVVNDKFRDKKTNAGKDS